VRRFLFDART